MTFRGLAWRTGLPLVLLVIAATVTLALFMSLQIAAEERARLERLAAANGAFINQTSLTPTEELAKDLQRTTGYATYFRSRRFLIPQADAMFGALLLEVPPDGVAHRVDGHECVRVELLDREEDLLFVRAVGNEFLDERVVRVLAAFWLLSVAIAWWSVRGLVRPLRTLAGKLPSIESAEEVDVPEARRNDEIGDVARSFLAAGRALRDEREQRARVEKLAVLGRMTASLAHEIQNPVAAIKMHAQLWRTGDGDAAAAVVVQEAQQIEDLVDQWMFLTKPEPPALRERDVAQLLEDLVRDQRQRLEHARVRVTVTHSGSTVLPCDARRLRHVFVNLLTNATQAMFDGGALLIAIEGTRHEVHIDFRDEGRGFTEQALARFGEYFYSEREGGMGIGLAVVREIVAAHGGSIRAENRATGGASVRVSLPRVNPAPAATHGHKQ